MLPDATDHDILWNGSCCSSGLLSSKGILLDFSKLSHMEQLCHRNGVALQFLQFILRGKKVEFVVPLSCRPQLEESRPLRKAESHLQQPFLTPENCRFQGSSLLSALPCMLCLEVCTSSRSAGFDDKNLSP